MITLENQFSEARREHKHMQKQPRMYIFSSSQALNSLLLYYMCVQTTCTIHVVLYHAPSTCIQTCRQTEICYLEPEYEHDPMSVKAAEEVEEGSLFHKPRLAHPRPPLLHFLGSYLTHHVPPFLLEGQLGMGKGKDNRKGE